MHIASSLYSAVSAFRQPLMLAVLMGLATCSPKVDSRGHVDALKQIDQLIVGRSHKQDVMRLLGSPSTTSTFGEERWYYITARKEAFGFLAPKVTQQNVTQITFDADGMVSAIERHGLNERRDIEVTQDITPTEGHQLGFFEQLLGNVGRFNKPPQEAR